MSITLLFDRGCTTAPEMCEEPGLSKWGNAAVKKVRAFVKMSPPELFFSDLRCTRDSTDEINWSLDNPASSVAVYTLQRVLHYVNRLISFARDDRGQFNLGDLSIDPANIIQHHMRFRVRIRIGDSPWVFWDPPAMGGIVYAPAHPFTRCIRKDDWPALRKYVKSPRRPPLVRELLAGAESLADRKHNRAALTEAITALEVAISNFARIPGPAAAFGPERAARLAHGPLQSYVKHLGLTGSVRYLFPLLFSEDSVPAAVLGACGEAIDVRNNIVHNGQRSVDQEKLKEY
ncbi:MAG: hypothetical protein WD069_02865, partial [Planctomycetales bacterium]